MKYILLNISFEVNSATEEIMDNKILKEFPFGSKFKSPTLDYNNVLIPLISADMTDQDFILNKNYVSNLIGHNFENNLDIIFSVYSVLKEIISNNSMRLSLNSVIDDSKIEIIYTDGSSSTKLNTAGYGVCKLLEESSNGTFDNFTEKKWTYSYLSGRIENGTNNVGELTAVRTAINNLNSEKKIHVIIADSIYSLKSFREYVYVWKGNNWLAYNKKPIKNKELIQDTYNELLAQTKNNIILFKWTKGHADNPFNEICDELAKKESGVSE